VTDVQLIDALDREVRRVIYERFMTSGRAPAVAEVAQELSRSDEDVRGSFGRLATGRVVVLQEGNGEILMANPFSAVPTPFLVEAGDRSWYGNCIWDALGIPAMLGEDARITTGCGDCSDAMVLRVEGGRLVEGEGLIHFAVPAARWWENIKFT
jgi:hypothetical protein